LQISDVCCRDKTVKWKTAFRAVLGNRRLACLPYMTGRRPVCHDRQDARLPSVQPRLQRTFITVTFAAV
jgi:hypothetical protein